MTGTTGTDPVRQMTPGIYTAAHLWLKNRAELLISGRVWRIGPVAKKLKVDAMKLCWPVLLSARHLANKIGHCEHGGRSGHENMESAAHRVPQLKVVELVADATLWLYPTEEEVAKLQAQMEAAGLPVASPGRKEGEAKPTLGKKRGRDGRGSGRGRRGFR